jgi:hypothetical protein
VRAEKDRSALGGVFWGGMRFAIYRFVRNLFFKGSKRNAASLLPRIRQRIETILVQERQQARFLQDWLTQLT